MTFLALAPRQIDRRSAILPQRNEPERGVETWKEARGCFQMCHGFHTRNSMGMKAAEKKLFLSFCLALNHEIFHSPAGYPVVRLSSHTCVKPSGSTRHL